MATPCSSRGATTPSPRRPATTCTTSTSWRDPCASGSSRTTPTTIGSSKMVCGKTDPGTSQGFRQQVYILVKRETCSLLQCGSFFSRIARGVWAALVVDSGGCGGEVVGEALAGASLQARRGSGPDGEQALYRDTLFAEYLFEAFVLQRRPGFQASDLCVGFGRLGEGRAAELPVLRHAEPVWIGQELLVPGSSSLGVPPDDGLW